MKAESFFISSHMTHQGYPLSVKRNDFRKKRLLVNDMSLTSVSDTKVNCHCDPKFAHFVVNSNY